MPPSSLHARGGKGGEEHEETTRNNISVAAAEEVLFLCQYFLSWLRLFFFLPTLEVKIGGKEERMKEEEEEEEEALSLFFFLLSLSFPARVGHLSDKDFLPLSHKKRRIRPKKKLTQRKIQNLKRYFCSFFRANAL